MIAIDRVGASGTEQQQPMDPKQKENEPPPKKNPETEGGDGECGHKKRPTLMSDREKKGRKKELYARKVVRSHSSSCSAETDQSQWPFWSSSCCCCLVYFLLRVISLSLSLPSYCMHKTPECTKQGQRQRTRWWPVVFQHLLQATR